MEFLRSVWTMMTQRDSETDLAIRDSVAVYSSELEGNLLESDDDALLNIHELSVRKALHYFHTVAGILDDDELEAALQASIMEAFMDVMDLNWTKSEEFCRETLDSVENTILCVESSSDESEKDEDYWNLMKTLHRKYDDEIGSSLRSKMEFVRLEYLDERQEIDYEVLMEQLQKPVEDANPGSAAGGCIPENSCTSSEISVQDANAPLISEMPDANAPLISEMPESSEVPQAAPELTEENFGRQLKLQMTWGRVLIFWKYWIDSRNESLQLLETIGDLLESEDMRPGENKTPTGIEMEPSSNVLDRVFQGFPKLMLQFSHTINKDFRCYKVLLRKLQDFVDMVNSEVYLEAFAVESKDLFLNVTTFQTDLTLKPLRDCCGLRISESILSREQDGLGVTAQFLACTSRPLFHLKDLFLKLADGDCLCAKGMRRTVIKSLRKEENDMSEMFSESLLSFLEVSAKVHEVVESLRQKIHEWRPKRVDTIKRIREIIEKLHKTTKDVAITQVVSSSVAIVGGSVATVGLILAPFTLGTSLIATAIASGVVSTLGAATAIGAAVTEIFIDKNEMEKATTCLNEDKELYDSVVDLIRLLRQNSSLLLRYIPQDELESFISVVTNPKSTAMLSMSSTPNVDPRIAINVARLVSVGGKAVVMPISRMVLAGTVAASRVAVLAVAHGFAAIGVALDIANLVMASVKLGKGARSENAGKLEEVVAKLEEEKRIVDRCLEDIQ